MKKLESNPYQCKARRVLSKKSKPIPALPRGAGLKSYPIPAALPLQCGKNSHGSKRGGAS